MTREFYILLLLLFITGFGTAAVIFFHDDSQNSDPMFLVQQDVCFKLRKSAIRSFQRRELIEAEAEVRRLLKLDPENREMTLFFGRILFETGRRDEAEAVFRHLLAVSPLDKGARNNLAVLMAVNGSFEAARKEFSVLAGGSFDRQTSAANLAVMEKAIELTGLKRSFVIVPESARINSRNVGVITLKIVELHPENKANESN